MSNLEVIGIIIVVQLMILTLYLGRIHSLISLFMKHWHPRG
jgi:hypothetical protein